MLSERLEAVDPKEILYALDLLADGAAPGRPPCGAGTPGALGPRGAPSGAGDPRNRRGPDHSRGGRGPPRRPQPRGEDRGAPLPGPPRGRGPGDPRAAPGGLHRRGHPRGGHLRSRPPRRGPPRLGPDALRDDGRRRTVPRVRRCAARRHGSPSVCRSRSRRHCAGSSRTRIPRSPGPRSRPPCATGPRPTPTSSSRGWTISSCATRRGRRSPARGRRRSRRSAGSWTTRRPPPDVRQAVPGILEQIGGDEAAGTLAGQLLGGNAEFRLRVPQGAGPNAGPPTGPGRSTPGPSRRSSGPRSSGTTARTRSWEPSSCPRSSRSPPRGGFASPCSRRWSGSSTCSAFSTRGRTSARPTRGCAPGTPCSTIRRWTSSRAGCGRRCGRSSCR